MMDLPFGGGDFLPLGSLRQTPAIVKKPGLSETLPLGIQVPILHSRIEDDWAPVRHRHDDVTSALTNRQPMPFGDPQEVPRMEIELHVRILRRYPREVKRQADAQESPDVRRLG